MPQFNIPFNRIVKRQTIEIACTSTGWLNVVDIGRWLPPRWRAKENLERLKILVSIVWDASSDASYGDTILIELYDADNTKQWQVRHTNIGNSSGGKGPAETEFPVSYTKELIGGVLYVRFKATNWSTGTDTYNIEVIAYDIGETTPSARP